MIAAVVAGSTGLVGSQMVSHLLTLPSISSVHAYSRRQLPNSTSSSKLAPLTSTDTSTWPSLFPKTANAKIYLSGLGTTYAAAGSLEAQRAIDVDLNYTLAKAAKESGVEVCVLISSASANSSSWMGPYVRMKGEIEDKIASLGFKHTIFVRPGVILGQREKSRGAEQVLQNTARLLGRFAGVLKESWAQEDEVIGRAAVVGALECVEGRREEGVWVMGQAEILRLGKKKEEREGK